MSEQGAWLIAEAIERNLRRQTDVSRAITAERNRQEALRDGRLRIGGPGDWYESIRWTWQAWDAIRPLEQRFARWPR